MSRAWPVVLLGEVLTKSQEWIDLKPDEGYREVTVRLWGKGVVERRQVTGAEVAASRRSVVRSQQFILSRIDARNGASGIVPDTLNGAIVSNDFPVFTPNPWRLLPAFLGWMSKTPRFVDICQAASEGTTNRVRLKEDRLLVTPIPLPPLSEEGGIVARIEELASRIEEAKGLRQEAVEEVEALVEYAVGAAFRNVVSFQRQPLSTLTSKIGSGSTPKGGRASYPSSGIPFIRSLNVRMRKFHWDGIAFIDEETHQMMSGTHVKPDDVLLNITGASIGRVACAPQNLSEANVNQHATIIRPLRRLNPRYLMYWLSRPTIQELIDETQKGATRQGFTKAQIEAFDVPIPPLSEQRRIVDAMKRLQAETAAELEAMLPSILDRAFNGEL